MAGRLDSVCFGTILALVATSNLHAQEPGFGRRESRGGLVVRYVTYSRSAPVSPTISTRSLPMAPRQDPQPAPLAPAPSPPQQSPALPAASSQLASDVFRSGSVSASQLAQERRGRASAPSSDIVLGRESGFRATTDAGSLLGKSNQTRGVAAQRRTPIITDTRVRGAGVGSLVVGG